MRTSPSTQREERAWFEQALTALADSGSTGRASAEYIRQHCIRLGFARQEHTGASWFDWRKLRWGIFLNTHYVGWRPDDPQLYALIAHEAKHLEQGVIEALSVRGELVAWQLQYDILVESSAPLAHRKAWEELHTLKPDDRADLEQARKLTRQIAGPGYLIDRLPLWPLPAEALYRLRHLGKQQK